MSADPSGVLRRAATTIFEELCFLEVEPGEQASPASWDVVSTVRFHGEKSGHLVMRLTGVDPRGLAEAMLGDEDALDEALCLDAVGELTNVLCGNVLPEIAGARANFDLHRPEVHRRANCEAPSREATRVLLGVESGVVEIELSFDSPIQHRATSSEVPAP